MRLALAAIVAAGCYNPAYKDCEVSCASGNGCPDDFTCDMTLGKCRVPNAPPMCGGNGDDAGPTCGWMYATNFNPCSLGTVTDVDIQTAVTYDSDIGQSTTGMNLGMGTLLQRPGAPTVRMLAFEDLRITPQGTLTVTGATPLLIAANTVTIGGAIDLSGENGAVDPSCDAQPGIANDQAAGGGGGGGFGSVGGMGGEGGLAGTATGNAQGGSPIATAFSPLRGSCTGRPGGKPASSNATAGSGGYAGGAIQITAHDSIDIAGAIRANGGGGTGATSTPSGCAGGSCGAGGGGGGAGGVIFLEAPQINFTGQQAKLCANGGGGGGGAGGGAIASTSTGGGGLCGNVPGNAGSGVNSGGNGGGGGFVVQPNGISGADGNNTIAMSAGGGGGGSAGRIGIRGTVTGTRQVESPAIEMLP